LIKITRIQIATIALAVFGILQFVQFGLNGFDLSSFTYIGEYPVEVSMWALKNLVLPLAYLVLVVAAFLPKSFISTKQLPLVTTISAGIFLAQEIYVAGWQSTRGYPFAEALLGYYAEFNMLAVVNIARLLVIGALVVAILELRKQAALAGKKKAKGQPSAFKAFLGTLLDSSLENFISRKVSGVLYIITAWIFIAAGVIAELALIAQMANGNIAAFLAFLVVPVALLLVLIVVRMAFEAGIALIVIAENTKK
jgi:hypothetical protein